ncbi:hypothetical protein BD779DRAFT_1524376 [Infundibulicybe gibba]|nr:hypothetical protein BD779DRAFT_1524376 [Infundibulicybe gibba]
MLIIADFDGIPFGHWESHDAIWLFGLEGVRFCGGDVLFISPARIGIGRVKRLRAARPRPLPQPVEPCTNDLRPSRAYIFEIHVA